MQELLIQHTQDERMIKLFRVKPENDLFTIGSGRNCDIRILGDDIDIIHACLEFRNNRWLIVDLCSRTGTWIQNDSIIEHFIDSKSNIQIGVHKLIIDPIHLESFNIFKKSKKIDIDGKNAKIYQQIVTFYKGELWESHLYPSKKKIKIKYDRAYHEIALPESSEWKEFKLGELTVRNRLVKSSSFETEEKSIWRLFPEDLIKPMGIAFGSTVVFFLILYLIPMALSSDSRKVENQYTKLIFDQKTIEKQRKKAKKLVKQLTDPKASIKKKKNPSPPPSLPRVNAPRKKVTSVASSRGKKKVNVKVSRVSNVIKASGLSSLVNKVASRAASNARLIESSGAKASAKKTNRGFASLDDLKSGGQISAATEAGSFRVGGVKTKGVAGGRSISGSLGGLSGGSVGSASVASLESEAEIKGGLTADQIKNVVQKNIGSIRYCYERQLSAHPNLYGKIKVQFVIDSRGGIITQKIKSTTMNNPMVEGCILRKVKKWVFPQPKGGTEVAVSYPFYFKSTK